MRFPGLTMKILHECPSHFGPVGTCGRRAEASRLSTRILRYREASDKVSSVIG